MPVSVENQQRIAGALDVSGAMKNCFFHAFSAYLLSNNLPLPADLFAPNAANGETPAEQLKTLFTSTDDLELFAKSYTQKHPGTEAGNMLVEKTLVLGVLCREWFAKKLLANTNHKEDLMQSVIQFLPIVGEDFKEAAQFACLYESNKAFFDGQIQNFNEADLRTYWNNEGYQRYCNHLATSGVTISPWDVAPVLNELHIPYTFYDQTNPRTEILREPNHAGILPLEIALHPTEGHYFLLKTPTTAAALDAYKVSFDQYKLDREAVLALPGNAQTKYNNCLTKSSTLLAVTLPEEPGTPKPVELLIRQIVNIKANLQPEQPIDTPLDESPAQPSTPRSELSDATTNPIEPTITSTEATAEDAVLTEREHKTFEATLAALTPEATAHEKFNNYKEILNALILASRHLKPRADAMPIEDTEDDLSEDIPDLDKAEAKQGEDDQTFAERLQEAEFKRSGLK